jgi:3-isopropylmalate/(R)-2-methylmalate dehydratase small subunit
VTGHKIRGRVWKFGDNIDTDQIIPAKYCNTFQPDALAPYVMEGADADFAKRVAPGDIIVAGHNFGCGSSREAAPIAIAACGVGAVIAHSFARLFFRNAVNIGLQVLLSPSGSESIKAGDELEIDLNSGIIYSKSSGLVYQYKQYSGIVQEIMEHGGMVEYVKQRLGSEHKRPKDTCR